MHVHEAMQGDVLPGTLALDNRPCSYGIDEGVPSTIGTLQPVAPTSMQNISSSSGAATTAPKKMPFLSK